MRQDDETLTRLRGAIVEAAVLHCGWTEQAADSDRQSTLAFLKRCVAEYGDYTGAASASDGNAHVLGRLDELSERVARTDAALARIEQWLNTHGARL